MFAAARIWWSAHALAFCAIVVVAMPPSGRETSFDQRSPTYPVQASFDDDGEDDGLMLSEIPVILLTNRSGAAVAPDWMELETDSCGFLKHIRNSRSLFRQSAAEEDPSDSDEDPSDRGRELITQWLSDHSELAVINDAIDKSCGDESIEDEPPAPDVAIT